MIPGERRRTSLLLRDLSAGAAFGGMAVSGEVPTVVLVLFGVALLLALFDRRPLAPSPVASGLLLIGAAGVVGLFVFQAGLDPVIGACSFAALLGANRMLSDRTPATGRQVHLASLLMVSGGAALSGELLFGALLLLFSALAVLSVALAVVEEASDPSEALPRRALLGTAGLGAFAILFLGAVLFLLFPRLSWNVAGRRVGRTTDPSTGFSDRVGLGGDGALKRDLRPVMRVRLDPDPGREELDAYWVGRRYLDFDGRDWRNHERFRGRAQTLTLSPGGRHAVLNSVELLPTFGARTLIALDRPILFGGAVVQHRTRRERTDLVRAPSGEVRFAERGVSYSYIAYSLDEPDRVLSEAERARALKLPQGLDPRLPGLARTLAPKDGSPRAVAFALEAALRRDYRYSLTLDGQAADPLADFLFVRKAGHCEHFATALAVLLRERGIPSRVVSGFYGGERVEGEYVLRGGDAHAWVEAWLTDHWQRLDATPAEARTAQASVWAARLARAWEQVDSFWRNHVLDYTVRDQLTAVHRFFPRSRPSVTSATPSAPARWPRTLLGLALAGLGLFALRQLFRHPPAPRHRREATRLCLDAERLLARHGHPLSAHASLPDLEALSHTLAAARHPASPALSQLTRRYLEARFGTRALVPRERQALLRALARALSDAPRRAA